MEDLIIQLLEGPRGEGLRAHAEADAYNQSNKEASIFLPLRVPPSWESPSEHGAHYNLDNYNTDANEELGLSLGFYAFISVGLLCIHDYDPCIEANQA